MGYRVVPSQQGLVKNPLPGYRILVTPSTSRNPWYVFTAGICTSTPSPCSCCCYCGFYLDTPSCLTRLLSPVDLPATN